jgi:hypothetical protein
MRRMIAFGAVLLFLLNPFSSAAQNNPGLVVSIPSDGATINGTDVTINFQVSGITLVPTTVSLDEAGKRPEANRPGEGHLHFMLDLQPVVVWERNTPYTFSNVPPGEHLLMVELVNNDHSPLSPQVVKQIRFRSAVMMPQTGTPAVSAAPTLPLWSWLALTLIGLGWLLRSWQRPLLMYVLPKRRDK